MASGWVALLARYDPRAPLVSNLTILLSIEKARPFEKKIFKLENGLIFWYYQLKWDGNIETRSRSACAPSSPGPWPSSCRRRARRSCRTRSRSLNHSNLVWVSILAGKDKQIFDKFSKYEMKNLAKKIAFKNNFILSSNFY